MYRATHLPGALAGAFAAWLGAVPLAAALPIIDQFQLDGSDQNQGIHSVRSVGQTWTSGVSGRLSGVELSLFELGDGPGLTVQVLDFSGGTVAGAPVLGSVLLDETDLGAAPLTLDLNTITATFVDLSTLGIAVEVGDALAVRLLSDRVLDPVGQPLFAVRVAFGDPYAGGGFFVGEDFAEIGGVGLDAAFKIAVDIPAPGSAALLALGLLGLALRRRASG